MRSLFYVFAVVFIVLFCFEAHGAPNSENIQYAKNYLVVLVHGIGDGHECLNNIKQHLKSNGLDGYVYAYEFSDPFLNIEKEGWEFGNRSYDNPKAVSKKSDVIDDNSSDQTKRKSWEITKRLDNGQAGTGKSWLEQAKEDFKIFYASLYRTDSFETWSQVPDSLVPSKFIVIAHSMGGTSNNVHRISLSGLW